MDTLTMDTWGISSLPSVLLRSQCYKLHVHDVWLLWIVWISTTSVVIAIDTVPRFTEQPHSQIVRESDSVTLNCAVSPGGATITWLYDDEPISDMAGVEVSGGHLVVKSFRKAEGRRSHHEGVYQCVGTSGDVSLRSLPATLEATYIGDFYEGPQDKYINVTKGNVAYIPCSSISGRPRPDIYFEINGTRLDTTSDRYAVLPSGELQIGNVTTRDRGIYRCVAYNPIGQEYRRAKRVVHLDIISPVTTHPPVFKLVPPLEVEVTRGDNLTLECVVEGAPVPVVTWSKYGGKLKDGHFKHVFGNLQLTKVDRLDEGTYICAAYNNIGTRQVAIAQVDVHEPPMLQSGPSDLEVTMGTSATFQCQGRGKPSVTVQWYHNGQLIKGGKGIITLNDTQLTVNQVGLAQEGVYQCIVSNALGSVSATATLSIAPPGSKPHNTQRPQINDQMQGIAPDLRGGGGKRRPPGGRNRGRDQEPMAQEGRDDTSTPGGDGDHHDDDLIDITGEDTADNNRGGRGNRGNRGERGNRGRNKQRDRLDDPQNPGTADDEDTGGELTPPTRPKVSKISDTSVMLDWRVPVNNGLQITFFKVQYKELVEDKQRRRWRTIDEDIPTHIRRFEVLGLKPGSSYRFRIVGVYSNNDNKHGPNSRKFTMAASSRPKVPLTGPVIVEARPVSKTAIALKWQYMPEEWTPLEGFIVYYQVYASSGAPQKLNVLGAHIRETELEQLQPNTMYSVRMKGFNLGGESDFSNTVVQSTLSTSGGSEFDYNGHNFDPGQFPTNWPGQIPVTTTTEVTPSGELDATFSTEDSNRTLYIVLGCALGLAVIILLFFMGLCAWKQKQRARNMLAVLHGENKFQDQSRTIHTQDSLRHKPNGNGFLLNGIGPPSHNGSMVVTGHNGTMVVAGHNGSVSNGHLAGYQYPHITANPVTEDSLQHSHSHHSNVSPGHHGHSHHHGNDRMSTTDGQSSSELRASLQEMLHHVPPPPPPHDSKPHHDELSDRYDPDMSTFGRRQRGHQYMSPPEYHSLSSRRSTLPDYRPSPQPSLHSQNSSSYRVHDPYQTDHIPRSHDRKYTRPSTLEGDRSSEYSHSSSSQLSGRHRRRHLAPDNGTNDHDENARHSGQLHPDVTTPSNHHHSNRHSASHHHGNHESSHHHGNHESSHHHGNHESSHNHGNHDSSPHHGNHDSSHHHGNHSDASRTDSGCHGNRPDSGCHGDSGECSDRDYESVPDSSPPPAYSSPDSPLLHRHYHGSHSNHRHGDHSHGRHDNQSPHHHGNVYANGDHHHRDNPHSNHYPSGNHGDQEYTDSYHSDGGEFIDSNHGNQSDSDNESLPEAPPTPPGARRHVSQESHTEQ